MKFGFLKKKSSLLSMVIVAWGISMANAAVDGNYENKSSGKDTVLGRAYTDEHTRARREKFDAELAKAKPMMEKYEPYLPSYAKEAMKEDPFYYLNVTSFYFNTALDLIILHPLSIVYNTVLPQQVRNGVGNVFNFLGTPLTALHDVLQFSPKRAAKATSRFLINGIFGLGGLFDVAKEFGVKHHKEDLGQTLGVWGVDSGPYLVLPVFGPSSFRDALGMVGDGMLNPMKHIRAFEFTTHARAVSNGKKAIKAIHDRVERSGVMDHIYNSLDPYTKMKALYIQRREFEILNKRHMIAKGIRNK